MLFLAWMSSTAAPHSLALPARTCPPAQELAFAAESLAFDAKNYHAWAHRQALVAAFGGTLGVLWERELALTERLLRDDVRNNSAWNQRFFVVGRAPAAVMGEPREVYDRWAGRLAAGWGTGDRKGDFFSLLVGLLARPGQHFHYLQ